MPALFAHYYFGSECLEALPEELAEICKRNRAIFDIGLHGPDIFFYYRPLKSNVVTKFGSRLHRVSGRKVFSVFAKRYQETKEKNGCLVSEASLAYLLGFLAHYAFDSSAHCYINQVPEKYDISHNAIEALYEVFLMEQQGIDPIRTNRAIFLEPSQEAAECISGFFAFPVSIVSKSIRGQKQTMQLLYSPFGAKKWLLRKVIALFHFSKSFGDLFLDRKLSDPERQRNAQSAIEEIEWLRKVGLERYPILVESLMASLQGTAELDDLFQYNFEGVKTAL